VAGAKAAFAAVSASSPARKEIAELWTIWLGLKSKAPAQAAAN
jgi:hypothetical protein